MSDPTSRRGTPGTGDTWRGFRLIPDDVLFFRNGKPSTRGSDHYLRSIFPPHPFTLYGALRTRRLLDEGVPLRGLARRWPKLSPELRAELGEWLGFGALEVRGPWLVRGDDEVLVPTPADLAIETAERVHESNDDPAPKPEAMPGRRRHDRRPPPGAGRVARLQPRRGTSSGGASHDLAGLEPCLPGGGNGTGSPSVWQPVPLNEQRRFHSPISRSVDWWLTPRGLAAWRAGGVPEPDDLVHREALWVEEQRTGVGLEDGDRKAEDSMIYTFGFVRLQQGVALGFEARQTELEAGGRVRLGGEARTALLEEGPSLPEPAPEERPAAGEPVRLAFATPTLSRAGAWPPRWNGDPGASVGALAGHRVELTGACVGGFAQVGGWDLARGAPKPLRRAVPAGSVYLLTPPSDDDLAALEGTCLSDYEDEHLARQGFGLALVGRG